MAQGDDCFHFDVIHWLIFYSSLHQKQLLMCYLVWSHQRPVLQEWGREVQSYLVSQQTTAETFLGTQTVSFLVGRYLNCYLRLRDIGLIYPCAPQSRGFWKPVSLRGNEFCWTWEFLSVNMCRGEHPYSHWFESCMLGFSKVDKRVTSLHIQVWS